MKIAKCKICGTEFETNYSKKVYCSGECRRIANDQRVLKSHRKAKGIVVTEESYKRTCLECGKTFVAKNLKPVKFCSAECRAKAKAEYQRNYRKALRGVGESATCEMCGKEFIKTKGTTVKFCSKECQQEWNKPTSERKRPRDSLVKADRRAKALGISYGKMKAMEYIEEMKAKGEY